jgi:hypothetical protein
MEEAGTSKGGPETGERTRRVSCACCRPNRGGGERLTCGLWQQCRAAVPLTSGARQVAGEGERGRALTGGTSLSAGVDGREAAAYAGARGLARKGKRWAEPRETVTFSIYSN